MGSDRVSAGIRAYRADQWRADAMRVDFIDGYGRTTKVLKRNESGNIGIIPAGNGKYVGALFQSDGEDPRHWAIFRYFDNKGQQIWQASLCCSRGLPSEQHVKVSSDGRVIVLLDLQEGVMGCPNPEDGYSNLRAPAGCVGIRVFTESGTEILRHREPTQQVAFSPNGKYVLLLGQGAETGFLLEVSSRMLEPLPGGSGEVIGLEVSDAGEIRYYEPGKRLRGGGVSRNRKLLHSHQFGVAGRREER